MKKLCRTVALFLATVMLLTCCPQGIFAVDGAARLTLEGAPGNRLELLADEEKTVSAQPGGFDAVSYSWQVLADKSSMIWVAIDGYTQQDCTVSKALVASLLDANGCAQLRCVATNSQGDTCTSDAVTVAVSEETAVSQQKVETAYYPGDLSGEPEVIDLTDTAPTEETSAPVEETTETTEETSAPVEETAETTEETAPPAEENAGIAVAAMLPADGGAEEPLMPLADETTEGDNGSVSETATIEVRYIFRDNTLANNSTFFNVIKGKDFASQVNLPSIIGYIPFLYKDGGEYYDAENHRLYKADGTVTVLTETDPGYNNETDRISSYTLSYETVDSDKLVQIVYLPAPANYTVVHYTEDLSSENYTEYYRVTLSGLTGYPVPDNLATDYSIPGFTAMEYERLNVAATGSTEIHIYHHRNYYFVDLDMNDAEGSLAYGAVPVYVRYGTTVTVASPKRNGFTFTGWTLSGYDPVTAGERNWQTPTTAQLQQYAMTNNTVTVPAAHLKYRAGWSQGNSYYTVVYWRERESSVGDAHPGYEYWGDELYGATRTMSGDLILNGEVTTGQSVNYSDYRVPSSISTVEHKNDSGDIIATFDEAEYFNYNAAETNRVNGNVTVEGDGSTVINVYYDRKTYNLKFYYAAQYRDAYYVMGKTNLFGWESRNANESTRNDEIKLFDQAWSTTYAKSIGSTLPEISNPGRYHFDQDTSTTGRIYYYFTFQAKYGADISAYWPTTNDIQPMEGGNRNRTMVFSAWNGESNVYYSLHRNLFGNNETIKGQYRRLDYRILWDTALAATSDDSIYQNTVSYLAYWNNVIGYDYNYPSLYRYNIYLECLDQHDGSTTCKLCEEKGPKTFTVNGVEKTYYQAAVYDVADNNDTTGNVNLQEQTHPAVYGFTNVNGDGLTRNEEYITMASGTYDADIYRNGYEIYWFYDRTRYPLEFHNRSEIMQLLDADGNPMDEVTVRYGVSLYDPTSSNTPQEKDYPTDLEPDGYVFEGWYTSPTFASSTKFLFDENSTMPAAPLILYANWVPKMHNVTVYYNEEDLHNPSESILGRPAQVAHNTTAPTPQDPPAQQDGKAPFLGWFYYNYYNEDGTHIGPGESPVLTAWSFQTMTVKHDMEIFAMYNYAFMNDYVIHFYAKELVDGEWIKPENPKSVAPDRTGRSVAGDHVLVEAAVNDQLYEAYRTKWFPDPYSDSLQISTNAGETTEYTIWYTEQEKVPYTVRYLDENGNQLYENGQLIPDKRVEDNIYAYVTETYKYISGYIPDAYQKSLAVSAANPDENVLIFYYKQSDQTLYRVEHHFEALDGTYVLDSSLTKDAQVAKGSSVTESIADPLPEGFKWNSGKTATTNNAVFTTGANSVTVSSMPEQGTLISLYYSRKTVTYFVHYHEFGKDTEENYDHNNDLADVFQGSGKYGQTVVFQPRQIQGYHLVGENSAVSLALSMNPDENQYTYWYAEDDITVTYQAVGGYTNSSNTFVPGGVVNPVQEFGKAKTGGLSGSTAQAINGYQLDGWYRDAACTVPVPADWLDESGTKLNPGVGNNGLYETATYYAKFVRATANLTINTAFAVSSAGAYSALDPHKTFIFTVVGTDDLTRGTNLTVTIQGKGSVTIENLPLGSYEITEMTDWSWRYEAVVDVDHPNGFHSIQLQRDTTDRYVLSREEELWLDGHAYNDNHYYSGGSHPFSEDDE